MEAAEREVCKKNVDRWMFEDDDDDEVVRFVSIFTPPAESSVRREVNRLT